MHLHYEFIGFTYKETLRNTFNDQRLVVEIEHNGAASHLPDIRIVRSELLEENQITRTAGRFLFIFRLVRYVLVFLFTARAKALP